MNIQQQEKKEEGEEATKTNGTGEIAPPVKAVVSFGDPTNFQTKHPLQNRWTWWYDNPGKKKPLNHPGVNT